MTADIPVTPEKIEITDGPRRSNSIGDFSILNTRVKVKPRYLNASFGSCHDFCKYGRKNVLVEKESHTIPKRKKKPAMNSKPLSDSNGQTPNEPPVSTSMKKRVDGSAKHGIDLGSKSMNKRSSSLSTSGHISNKRSNDVMLCKGVGVLHVSPVGGLSRTNSEIFTNKGKKKESVPPNVPSSPGPSIKRGLSGKPRSFKDPKEMSHLKRNNSVGKAEPKPPIDEQVSEKMLYAVETKSKENGNEKTRSSKSLSSVPEEKTLGSDKNKTKSSQQTPPSVKKKPKERDPGTFTTRFSSSSRKKSTMSKGDQNASSEARRGIKSDPVSEGSGTKTQKRMPNNKVERNKNPKQVGIIGLEVKNDLTQKLNFKKGKLVDVQPKNTAPRRLKFKPRRVIVENLNGKAETRRNLKKVASINEVIGSSTQPIKVVLKHQDVEGKKSVQSLLNNVIEETASRLVRIRKSKVKALVGAFESLKSLEDAKSSTTSAS